LAKVEEGRGGKPHALRIEEFMTTDLITVHPDEPMDLVIRLMDWRRIRHVPVEDEEGKVAGLLSCFEALRQWAPAAPDAGGGPVPVREVMRPDPVTIAPEATVTEAVARMRQAQSDYLLVVKEDRLVGIVTESDILQLTARLLEQLAGESGADGG
jgi:CBS domain-containing protein